jgi:hypothetical protein
MKTFRLFIGQLMLVLASFSGVSAGEGLMVLCLAADGHVAVEVGSEQCSSDESPAGARPPCELPMAEQAIDDCCGPCADVPLGSASFLSRTASQSDAPFHPAVVIAGLGASPVLLPHSDIRREREPDASRSDTPRVSLHSQLRC